MTTPAKCAACLLPFLMAGCAFHRAVVPVPLVAYPPDVQAPASLLVTQVELPPEMMLLAAKPIYDMPLGSQSIKQPIKHRKPANRNPEVVAVPMDAVPTPVPAMSAIGAFSSGDSSGAQKQTSDAIDALERGLNGINRPLNDAEQKTADQVRSFIKQAKTALTAGDMDGARNLAGKAKALLDELNK